MKAVLFDLDGVLIDAKEIHYQTLNQALGEYAITREEHVNLYDGKKTREKLRLLTELKNLPEELHDKIYTDKQALTIEHIEKLEPIDEITLLFEELKHHGYKIGVCTNSIRNTVESALKAIQLDYYCDVIISNEDVKNSKPHPQMYWDAMSKLGINPEEVLIVEDSPTGLLAAHRSGARYIRVDNPYDVTRKKIFANLNGEKVLNKIWKDDKLNVLIPMAGAGSRFAEVGYTFPKPLIEVNKKPMIQVVVENLGLDAHYIFVVQKEHRSKYNLDSLLNMITPSCDIVEADGLTDGAACTALLAKDLINNDCPLFFANSDQYVEWDPVSFMYNMQETNADGGIVCFNSVHPKWSYAETNDLGRVIRVAEKDPISNLATVGYYYWKRGSDFVKYAEQMIQKDIRVNGEFYVCPVFNEAIKDDKHIRIFIADKMWGLGTPEDLEYYIGNFK